MRRDRETHISQIRSDRKGVLAGHQGLVRFAYLVKMAGQIGHDPTQSVWIVQGLSEALGLLQVDQDLSQLAQRPKRVAQCEAEIDSLDESIAALREVLHGLQRLLEGSHRLPMG